jgi:arylsulfatase
MPQPRPLLAPLLLLLLVSAACGPAEPGPDLVVKATVEHFHLVDDGPLWLRLDLQWEPGPTFSQPFEQPRVFVHLLAPDGTMVGQGDHRPEPSIEHWQPGRPTTYRRALLVPRTDPELLEGRYRLRVGIYEASRPTEKFQLEELKLDLPDPADGSRLVQLDRDPDPAPRGWSRQRLAPDLPAADIRAPGGSGPAARRRIPVDQVSLARAVATDRERGPVLGVEIPAGGEVRFARVVPAWTRLVFSVGSDDGTAIRVALQKKGTAEKVLWEETVDGETGLLKFPLTGRTDDEALIRLENLGPGTAIWVEPTLETRTAGREQPLWPRDLPGRLREAADDWNVLVVIQDAARADGLSCYGNGRRTSPYLDRLARQGIQVVRATAQAPYTLSSTVSLFTGLYPTSHQVLGLEDRLPAALPHLAEAFRAAAFTTACVSASPFTSAAYGMNRGFDYHIDNFKRNALFTGPDVVRTTGMIQDYLAPRGDGRDRFFLYVHFLEPHSPYEPPEPFRSRFLDPEGPADVDGSQATLQALDLGQMEATPERVDRVRALYEGNQLFGDLQLAMLLAGLRRDGLLDRTLVIVTSDHGEAFMEHGRMLHNSTVYREMLQIPLVLIFPGDSVPSRLLRQPVETVDLTALLADLFLDGRSAAGLRPEGSSFLDQLAGAPAGPEDLGLALSSQGEVIGLRAGAFKLIQDGDGLRVFHRPTDPGETRGRPWEDRLPETVARQSLLRQLVQDPPPQTADDASSTGKPSGDAATREQLRALGYID